MVRIKILRATCEDQLTCKVRYDNDMAKMVQYQTWSGSVHDPGWMGAVPLDHHKEWCHFPQLHGCLFYIHGTYRRYPLLRLLVH